MPFVRVFFLLKMIPQDEDIVQNASIEDGQSQIVLEGDVEGKHRMLAHEEFSKNLELVARKNVTTEEIKSILLKAYMGCDLKYSKQVPNHQSTSQDQINQNIPLQQ